MVYLLPGDRLLFNRVGGEIVRLFSPKFAHLLLQVIAIF